MRRAAVLILGLCLSTLSIAAEKTRTWTNAQGRTMRAEFVREADGEVTFIKDGKLLTLSLDQLCEADQQLVGDLQAGGGSPAAAPPVDDSFGSPAGGGNALSAAREDGAPPLPGTKRRPPAIANRVWTLADGHQTTAKFVRIFRDSVVLLRGSRTVMYSYDALSPADQDYVKEVLTARGEESLIPPPATVVINDSAPPAEGESPLPASVATDENGEPEVAAAPSSTFDELHKRQEERRAQLAADLPAESSANQQTPPADAESSGSAGLASASNRGAAKSAISAEKLAELRPVLIIGGVVVGVIGMVAVIIAAAITIASASGRSRARRYS
jgi:hypothetical protein